MRNDGIFTDNTGQQIIKDIEPDSYIEIFLYSVKDFFSWWFVEMPVKYLRTWKRIMVVLNDKLSISLVLANLFLPWRRHNSFAGYFFGIAIKLIYLPFAVIAFLIGSAAYLAFIIFWMVAPFAVVAGIIKTLGN